jgi:hypothetical protein
MLDLTGAVPAGIGQLEIFCLHIRATTALWEAVGVQLARLAAGGAGLTQVGVARTWVRAEGMEDCWVAAHVDVLAEYTHLVGLL